MAEFYNPETLWRPFGAFSMMFLKGNGKQVQLKGQVSLDTSGNVVGPHDMRIQVDQALSNIEVALQSVGGQMGDVTELFQHTTDIDAFMQTDDIRQKYLSEPYPVTTTVEVVRLYDPELVVEITASAEIPLDRYLLAN